MIAVVLGVVGWLLAAFVVAAVLASVVALSVYLLLYAHGSYPKVGLK